jgi:ABC-type uncharacterized transport system involved in gliding motility auxiliary subunit
LADDRELLAIGPRDQALRPFIPNPIQERALLYVQVILLPALLCIAGLTVWRKRRRL